MRLATISCILPRYLPRTLPQHLLSSVFRAQPERVSAPPINFGSVVIGGFSPRYFPPGTHHGPRSCNYPGTSKADFCSPRVSASRGPLSLMGPKSPAMSTIQHARPVWMHSFCAPRHSAPTWDYVGQSKSQMRLAIARGISLCASGGCAARACSRAARLEASEKCNPWVCAIQMPGGEPLSLTRGRACPVMVCHGAHESLEAGLGVRQGRPRSARMHAHAHAHAHAHWVCTCVHGCALGVHGGVGVWAWA